MLFYFLNILKFFASNLAKSRQLRGSQTITGPLQMILDHKTQKMKSKSKRSRDIILKNFEMKSTNSRQKDSQNPKSKRKTSRRCQMPFFLQRHQYKQLIAYEKKGHWSQKQKLKYAVFLEYYQNRFQIKAKRRFNNIFDLMATFIKTRNPHQCRSHHQKMEKEKFKIDSIIRNTSSKYHPRVYEQLRDRYIDQIVSLHYDESQNFQKFKERIERIQERKAVQREVISSNKRILRSARPSGSNAQRSLKKMLKIQKRKEQIRAQQNLLTNSNQQHKPQSNVKRQQDAEKKYSYGVFKPQIQHMATFTPCSTSQVLPRQMDLTAGQINVNHYKYLQKWQILQNRKKHHLDVAYMHYNEYMKHVNEANTIQFQIMKENSIRGSIQNFGI